MIMDNQAQLDAIRKLGDIISPFITDNIKGVVAGGGIGLVGGICLSAINAFVGALGFISLTGPAAVAFLGSFGIVGGIITTATAPVALIVGGCVIVGCVIGGVVSLVRSTKNLKTAVRRMIEDSKKKNDPVEHNKFCDEMSELFQQAKFPDKKIN